MRTAALRALVLTALLVAPPANGTGRQAGGAESGYLSWTADQAQQVGRSMRVSGRVGGRFDLRVVHTERSYNYKLRATWLTPEVIRAAARLAQLSRGLSNEQTEALVREAEAVHGTVMLVEVDPSEGSGVIPLDWVALLGAKDQPGAEMVKGESVPRLADVPALGGVFCRDYDYEPFWMVFPVVTSAGYPLFLDAVQQVELVVRIHDKEGRVAFAVPASLRRSPGQ